MRRSGQQVSQYILLVGVLAIVAVMFWTATNYLSSVQLPEQREQHLEGPADHVAEQVGRLTDRCWKQANNGRSQQYIDCYLVNLSIDSGQVTDSDLHTATDLTPNEKITLPDDLTTSTAGVRIRYRPANHNITIS